MSLFEERLKKTLQKEKPQTGTQGGPRGPKRCPKVIQERKKVVRNETHG